MIRLLTCEPFTEIIQGIMYLIFPVLKLVLRVLNEETKTLRNSKWKLFYLKHILYAHTKVHVSSNSSAHIIN